MTAFRVRLWDTSGTGRGRGALTGVIDDAKDIGVSAYANDGGEFFMTLPANHPQISAISPWQTHYEVSRRNSSGTYDPIGVGLLDNYVHTENEVVVYGVDYMALVGMTITSSNTSYSSTIISNIISAELNKANNGDGAHGNSQLGFVTLGTIGSTTKTTTVLTSFENRLSFLRNLVGILSAGDTTRPLISINRSSAFSFTFSKNAGSDKKNVRLEYGGNINNFRYDPAYDAYITRLYAIGQKRDGASLLYSTQNSGTSGTYGLIQAGRVYVDLVDQTALDDLADQELTRSQNSQRVAIGISSGKVVPWDGFDLMDSVSVAIKRGLVNVNDLYTVWGLEWIGHRDGHEDLFLDLLPKLT